MCAPLMLWESAVVADMTLDKTATLSGGGFCHVQNGTVTANCAENITVLRIPIGGALHIKLCKMPLQLLRNLHKAGIISIEI